MKIKPVLFITFLVIFAFVLFYSYSFIKNYQKISIAFVGPLSGNGAAAGQLMVQAIQLYLDSINQQGGINGQKIRLDVFDDQNDPVLAKQRALEIVKQNRAIAVIGHWYSSTSISAGEIYKKYGIPAITPGSTNIKVTQDNEWYFRNIFNAEASGKFLAHYVKKILQEEKVTLISETGAYGAYLAQVFSQEAQKLNMEIKYQWEFQPDEANLDKTLQNIVEQLKTKIDAGVIFLAVQALEGVKLVKLIKEADIKNTLIGGTSLSEKTFRHGFSHLPKELVTPGYYTNDIYVVTPLIFDTANEKALQFREDYYAEYQEQPDWAAAYAYDTVKVVVEAIKKTKIRAQASTLKADRQKMRDFLANLITADKAVAGVTGLNYFDRQRNAQKPIVIGLYKNNQLISALTQLQIIHNVIEEAELDLARKKGQILQIDEQYLQKTNVVYTGIEINNIRELDVKNLTYQLDFNLWFRFWGEFDSKKLVFFNAVGPVSLSEPKVEKQGTMTYHVYQAKGIFRADFLVRPYVFKEHILGVSFYHSDLNRHHLIYVTDVLGMGLTYDNSSENSLLERLQTNQIINPREGWSIKQIYFFQDVLNRSALGHFKYLSQDEALIKYSRFNAAILIKKDEFALRGNIPFQWANHLVIFSSLIMLLLIIFDHKQRYKQALPRGSLVDSRPQGFFYSLKVVWYNIGTVSLDYQIWLLELILAFVFLLSLEVVLVEWLADDILYRPELLTTSFDLLWWLVPALFINIAINRFIWIPIARRSRRAIPNVVRLFVSFTIYLLAGFGIIAFVYEQKITSLLATSGMVAMLIGFVIQANLANIFSGIVINMERSFRVGDWIKVGAFDEGVVVDVNWRTTRLRRRNGDILSIPNRIVADAEIQNFNYTEGFYWLWPVIYIDPIYSPEKVQDILLKAVMAVEEGVLKDPAPSIYFSGVNEWTGVYRFVFAIDNYQNRFPILEAVWRSIWVFMDRAGIPFAMERQEIYLKKGQKTDSDYLKPKTDVINC
jgi:branched-chain amino acid transport system substrate-binding protein